jgi:hypothetical protein
MVHTLLEMVNSSSSLPKLTKRDIASKDLTEYTLTYDTDEARLRSELLLA